MRTSQLLKLLLGPILLAGAGLVAIAQSEHAGAIAPGAVWPVIALVAMLFPSVGTIVWMRPDRRRSPRSLTYKRCRDCGLAMRGIVDAQRGPLWRCVECLREDPPLSPHTN